MCISCSTSLVEDMSSFFDTQSRLKHGFDISSTRVGYMHDVICICICIYIYIYIYIKIRRTFFLTSTPARSHQLLHDLMQSHASAPGRLPLPIPHSYPSHPFILSKPLEHRPLRQELRLGCASLKQGPFGGPSRQKSKLHPVKSQNHWSIGPCIRMSGAIPGGKEHRAIYPVRAGA